MESPLLSCSTKSVIAALLWLSYMAGYAGAASASMHVHARNNTGSHNENNYSHLRSASSPNNAPSPADDQGSSQLNELKEIVLFLSEKMDDADLRIRSLEQKIKGQESVIETLKTEVSEATSFHRSLQSSSNDCAPKFRLTPFGPRCDFQYVTRFQNKTFFNDDAVFNENVEFDSDSNCMPVFNSTTKMCSYNNNITFSDGDINFDRDVRFSDTVKFDDNASFRDHVEMRSDVDFNGSRGKVNFYKDVKFTEDVLMKNDDHDIELRLEDKVKARFYQDRSIEIDTHTNFYQDVDMKKNLEVDEKLRVKKKSTLDDLELYGYLWVDGYTKLENTLEVKKQCTMKDKVKIESGGLEVTQHGASISGTTKLTGILNLYGNGFVNQDFTVDQKFQASSVLIQPTNALQRNLQFQPAPVPAPAPLLQVRGNAKINGELVADKIRSDDINGDIDVMDIYNKIKVEMRDDTVVFGDVRIKNSFSSEQVLTGTRMMDQMRSANLRVAKLVANEAEVGGQDISGSGGSMTGNEIVEKLKGKSLVDLLSVESLTMSANSATIGGKEITPEGIPADLDDVVTRLQLYEGEITLPYLSAHRLNMYNIIQPPPVQNIIPAKILVDGVDVALQTDIEELDRKIDALDTSSSVSVTNTGMTQDEIVGVLAGASLSLNSLDASSISKSSAELATIGEVNQMVSDAYVPRDSAATSCTCDSASIEDSILSKIDASYVEDLGFVTNTDISVLDLGGGGDCTCSQSDVQSFIDQPFLEALGVSFGSGEPQGCGCAAEDIQNAVDAGYIQGVLDNLGISGGGGEATCTCSADDVRAVVDYNYVSDLGFSAEASECTCDVEGIVTKDYISGLGFLDSCPCDDVFQFNPDER